MLPHQTLPPLAHITVRVSGVVPAVIIEVWKVVRGFGTVSEWMAPIGLERITSTLLPGSIEGQLGALRRVCFGDMGFVEQLDGLDDERHIVKWRVISHPLNTNPFPGSFLNYKAKIRLRKITITAATFMEIEAEFDTEHTSAEGMRRELTARHEASIRGLLTLLTAKPAQQQAHVQAMLASLPLGAGSSTSRSGGGLVANSGGIASVPLASAGVILPNGQVALVPNVARVSVPTPGNSGGLANSLSGGGIPDLSANLATSRVLASNNLAAQQALAEASVALHAQHLSAQAQLAGGVLPAVPLVPGAAPLVPGAAPLPLPGVLPGLLPGAVPGVLPGAVPGVLPGAVPGVLPGSLPASLHGSGGGLVPGAVPGVLPTAMPGAPHPTVLAAQLAALQGGLATPVLSGAGGIPPPDPRTINSYNSYTSNESIGSIRGNALGQALQQAQAGLLPDAQVAALQALQRQHAAVSDGRASFESNDARFRAPDNFVSNSGDSVNSFSAASPPRLSPRAVEKAKTVLSANAAAPAAPAAAAATLDGTGRVTSM